MPSQDWRAYIRNAERLRNSSHIWIRQVFQKPEAYLTESQFFSQQQKDSILMEITEGQSAQSPLFSTPILTALKKHKHSSILETPTTEQGSPSLPLTPTGELWI